MLEDFDIFSDVAAREAAAPMDWDFTVSSIFKATYLLYSIGLGQERAHF